MVSRFSGRVSGQTVVKEWSNLHIWIVGLHLEGAAVVVLGSIQILGASVELAQVLDRRQVAVLRV